MTGYLVDTTILIENLRGNEKARQFIKNTNSYISSISIAELIQGSRDKKELEGVLTLCMSIAEAVIDQIIVARALDLMKQFYLSHGMKFWDALIAATAIENKLTLVTDNVKHFTFIKGLQIVPQKEIFKNLD